MIVLRRRGATENVYVVNVTINSWFGDAESFLRRQHFAFQLFKTLAGDEMQVASYKITDEILYEALNGRLIPISEWRKLGVKQEKYGWLLDLQTKSLIANQISSKMKRKCLKKNYDWFLLRKCSRC